MFLRKSGRVLAGPVVRSMIGGKYQRKAALVEVAAVDRRSFRSTPAFFVKGTEVKMPSLSPTMTEGTIIKWHKKEGEKINPGEIICEIQTDKAVVGFEMDDEAVLAKILVREDTKDVKIGTLIALIVDEGEDWKEVEMPDLSSAPAPATESKSTPDAVKTQKSELSTSVDHSSRGGGVTSGRPQLVGPSVRNLLHHYGVEASKVPATGPHDALLKGDVLNFIKQNNLTPRLPGDVSAPSASRSSGGRPTRTPGSAPKFVDLEITNIRKIIAKRLTESKQTIPHAYMSSDCNLNKLIRLRTDLKNSGVSVSVNDFIIKAAGLSLKQSPGVNVRWNAATDSIDQVPTVDISIAVATPTGLITPIVKNANVLDVKEISSTVRELAGRAKLGKLQPHEFQGGSFSISNLGMFGISEFTAVINPPQSAILAVGTSRPVVNDHGRLDQRMTVTMSYDSRAVNEETAAKFLETFNQFISDPTLMDRSGDGSGDSRRLDALVN